MLLPVVRLGYLAVAAAAVLWAVGGTFARTLMDRGASPVELTEARAWIALVGVGAIVAVRGRGGPRGEPVSARLTVAFGLSLAAANFTYYLAISLLPVAVAIVVQYTAPGLVVLWKAAAEKQRPSRRVVAALLLALAGVALLAEIHRVPLGRTAGISALGMAAAMASALSFAAYVLMGERVGRAVGPERAVFYGFMVASLFWMAVQGIRGRPDTLLDVSFLPGILFLGVFATILPFLLFLRGLDLVKASAAGIISTLEPVSAAVLAYVWLGQALTLLQITGAASVVVAIAVVQSERPPSPEALTELAVVE